MTGLYALYLVLPDVEIGGVVEDFAPFPDELAAVALSARAPHGRAFRFVEHAELDGGGIGDDTHAAPESVDLAYYLSLGDAANGRVARHLRYLVHVHRNEARVGTETRSSVSRLATRMTASDNDNIVKMFHILSNFLQK